MKSLLIIVAPLLFFQKCLSQQLVIDPVSSAAIMANTSTINGQLNTTNEKLTLIQRGQLAVSGQLVIVNNMQDKIYKGLSQISSIINNLTSIKEIYECGTDIVSDVQQAMVLAKSNPALLLFAERGARDFETRTVALAAEVGAFVLKGGTGNLMDSGERGKLINHIAEQMRILRGIAYGMNRAMYWAKMNGIFRSLNPWAEWQNQDVRIANDIINNAKALRQ